MLLRMLVFAGLGAVAAVRPLQAQSPTGALPSGAMVRVRAATIGSGHIQGRHLAVEGSELVLETATGPSRIPLAGVTELRRANARRHVFEGAMLGFAAGAAMRQASSSRRQTLLLGQLVGVVAGAAIGYHITGTRWDVTSLRAVRAELLPGTRVRLRGGDGSRDGVIEGIDGGVTIRHRSGASVRLTEAEATRLEWPLAQERATERGIVIGALLGGLTGAVMGAGAGGNCSGALVCFSEGEMAVAMGLTFGAIGTAVGGLIGSTRRLTVWERAPAPRGAGDLVLQPVLQPRRVGLSLTARF